MSATGTAIFDRQGALARLDFTNVRRGALNDLAFTLTKDRMVIPMTCAAVSWMASAIGRNASCNAPPGGPEAPPKPDEKPEGSLSRYRPSRTAGALRHNVSINDLIFDLSATGDRPSALSPSGKIGGNAAISAALENAAQGRRVTIKTADGGCWAGRCSVRAPACAAAPSTSSPPCRAAPAIPTAAANVPDFQRQPHPDQLPDGQSAPSWQAALHRCPSPASLTFAE